MMPLNLLLVLIKYYASQKFDGFESRNLVTEFKFVKVFIRS